MLLVLLPVLYIHLRQISIPDDQQILSMLFLCGPGKVERSGDHRFLVNDHDLVVGDGVRIIYEDGNARICHQCG